MTPAYPFRAVADPQTVIARLAHGMHGGEDMDCDEDALDSEPWCPVCWAYASDWMAADSTWNSAKEVREALGDPLPLVEPSPFDVKGGKP